MADLITTSIGVVLEIRKPSVFALREVERQIGRNKPKPPEIYLEDKDRSEPNENDPDYLAAVNEWQSDGTERQYGVAIMTGTTIHSVPEDVPHFDSDEWPGILTAIGIDLGKTKQEQYLQWVKYIAAPSVQDMALILAKVLSLLGVREEEVAVAMDAFRSDETRGTDLAASSDGDNKDGNSLRTVARRNRATV